MTKVTFAFLPSHVSAGVAVFLRVVRVGRSLCLLAIFRTLDLGDSVVTHVGGGGGGSCMGTGAVRDAATSCAGHLTTEVCWDHRYRLHYGATTFTSISRDICR